MPINPKVKQIYDTLKEGGADVGSEKEFNDYFFAKGKDGYNNRKEVFNTLKEGGADAGKSYEEFAGWLGLHAVSPHPTQTKPAPPQRTVQAARPVPPRRTRPQQPQRSKGKPMTAAEKARVISNVRGIVRGTQAGLRRTQNMMTYAKSKAGLHVEPVKLGQKSNVVETARQYDPKTGKMQPHYLTEAGNEYDDKAQADMEQAAIDEQKRRELDPVQSQLEDAYGERDRLEEAIRKRRKELEDEYNSRPWYQRMLTEMGKAAHSDMDPAATATDSEHMGFEQDEQYMQLMSAIRKNHQTIQTLEDKKNGRMNSFWHSLGTALTNGYTFADGLPEMRDATAMLNAQKHIDSINRKRKTGQALTKEEEAAEAVLRNTLTDNAVQGTYGSEYGAWGRAGSGMAQSIDFMKDFLLLPGAGSIAKGVAGKVAGVGGKYLAKKAGETAVKAAAKAIARATLKATGVVAGAHAAGAVISNTTGIGRTAAKMGQLGTGNVGMDKNGNYKMENQKDLMRAFAEAEREQARENGSEMFGEFIPGGKALSGVAKKALSKIGLGRISDMLTRIGNKAWYKNYTDLLSKGGYNGIPGEALEEYEGMFFDAITGHADEAVQDFTDPKQQVDIWLGCATMGALMGAVPMGLHIQGYYRYKHGMDRADRTADFRLTPEKWQPLKEQIDQTDNGNMSGLVVDNILDNKNLDSQEKEAAMDYVRNLTKFRGFNIAQVNNAEEAASGLQAEDRQQDEDRQQAYETGREAADMADTDGDRSDADAIVLHLREAYGEIERVFGDDAEMRLARLEDDPWEVMDDQSLTPEQQDAVAYFVNSKAAMDGLNDAVDEKGDNKRDEATRQIEQRTNRQSGMIHPATLKADDRQVYIVSGNITMFPDGSAVDVPHSSESVVVCDAETGELKFISPEQICKVDEPVDPGMELKAVDGAIHAERQAILGNEAETEVSESEETPGQSEDERPRPVQQGTAAGEGQAEGTALERIPKDGNGQPLLEQTDPETAWDGVVEYMEDADDAKEYVGSMVARLSKEAEAAAKAVGRIKPADSMAQFKADKAAARQTQAAAEARLELWKQIADVDRKRRYAAQTAEQEKRAARETEIHQQAVKAEERRRQEELQKRAEQSERGANNVASVIREKWNTAPKIDGAPNEIVLPDGERVSGHYVLTESGAASPSHNATAEFAKTEGFPVDGNGQSVNDRDYERDRDAQAITRSIARNYDSRALQSPVVVSRDGVVLSGNGRTMAGELAAADNTDAAYVEHLQKYPQQYGFTPEQVQGMQHPRVVFVPNADMPYSAETFAKFNQQEMKGQSKTEQAVKLGKVVDDTTFAHITRAINGYDTLGEFYADSKAAHAAVRELQAAGVLTHAQMAEMSDGEGLSAQGKEVLENMLIGKAFESNPDAIREITAFKSVRQSVITALAEIVNNKSLGADYSLEYELAQAVDLVYKARKANHKAGDRVSSFARQQNLFSFDEGDTVADYNNATMLMLADVLNDNRSTQLKKILAVYNQKAADSAAGQTDMFSGGVKTKEEIWNEVKQLIDYGTEEEQQQAVKEAAERRKESVLQDEPSGRGDKGGGGAGDISGVKLSKEVDEDGSPFVESSLGSTTFGEIKEESGLAPAPIKLSLGNSKYGLIHIERRHGEQIRNAGFASVKDFVEFVCKNYKQIRQGENSLGEANGTYLIQIEDDHNNTLYIELSTDNTYWGVNSDGVFRNGYGKNKKEVWSASEVQNEQSAADSTLREEEKSDSPTPPNGNVPNTSFGKDIKESDIKQEKPEKFVPSAKRTGENILDYAARVAEEHHAHKVRKAEEAKVDTHPTEAQKASGNYKKGHIRVDGLDITIEQPKGSIRRGKDANGKEWESEMHSTYGYIRGTKGTDGDHIDVYLSDHPTAGNVYVVDQVNQQTGEFDEHKVMYGFGSMEEAVQAYRDQYEDGWKVGTVTEVSREEFKKWVESSTRKTKPFAEYKSVKPLDSEHAQPGGNYAHNSEEFMRDADVKPADSSESYTITPTQYTNKKGKTSDMYLVKFNRELSKEEKAAAKAFVNAPLAEGRRTTKGWYTRVQEGYMVRSKEAAKQLGDMMADEVAVADEQPLTVQDYRNAAAPAVHKEQEKKPSDTVSAEDTVIQDAEAKVHSPEHKDSGLDFNGDISKEDFNDALKDLRSLLGVSDDEGDVGILFRNDDELTKEQRKKIKAAGLSVTQVLVDNGVVKFSDYADKMISLIGDKIRPWLKSFYEGFRWEPGYESVDFTPSDEVVQNFDKPSPDILKQAEMVVAEQKAAKISKQTEREVKSERNEKRKDDEKQTEANTAAIAEEVKEKPATPDLHGFNIGDKVMYKGKEATLYDTDNGRPVLDAGLAPVMYEVTDWDKLTPVSSTTDTTPATEKTSTEKEKPIKKNNSKKKSVSLKREPTVGDLFGDLFGNNDLDSKDNDTARTRQAEGSSREDGTVGRISAERDGVLDPRSAGGTDGGGTAGVPDTAGRVADGERKKVPGQRSGGSTPGGNHGDGEITGRLSDGGRGVGNGAPATGRNGHRGSAAASAGVQEKTGSGGEGVRHGMQADGRSSSDPGGDRLYTPAAERPSSSETAGNRREVQGRGRRKLESKFKRNYLYPENSSEIDNMTPQQRLRSNVEALEVVRTLMKEGREATADERAILGRYRGWGGVDLGRAYSTDMMRGSSNGRWGTKTENDKLLSRLADIIDELDPNGKRGVLSAINRAALTSYYTPTAVARVMNGFVEQAGFKGGSMLDPSMGSGIFEGTMSKAVQQNTMIHGIELDWLTGQIARNLYPDANVLVTGYEQAGTADNA